MKVHYNATGTGISLSDVAIQRAKQLSIAPEWRCLGERVTAFRGSRHDPILAQVVEEMGDAANGDYCVILYEEVAEGSQYAIDNSQGGESVVTSGFSREGCYEDHPIFEFSGENEMASSLLDDHVETSWRELIANMLKARNETWDDVIAITMPEAELDVVFRNAYGNSPLAKQFTAWTANYVYFPSQYDGAQWCDSVARNPPAAQVSTP